MLNSPNIPGICPTWLWYTIKFAYCWNQFAKILIGITVSMFMTHTDLVIFLLIVSLSRSYQSFVYLLKWIKIFPIALFSENVQIIFIPKIFDRITQERNLSLNFPLFFILHLIFNESSSIQIFFFLRITIVINYQHMYKIIHISPYYPLISVGHVISYYTGYSYLLCPVLSYCRGERCVSFINF